MDCRYRRFPLILRSGIGICLAASFAAHAQVSPGQVGDTLKRPPEVAEPPPATIETQRPEAAARPAVSGPTVTVTSFRFAGNKLYPSLELEALVADYLNRPLSLLDIYAAADRVALHYAKAGYSLATVNVPPQKISDGTVLLEISEGRVGQVVLEQPARRDQGRVQKYLGVNSGDLYQSNALEHGLLQLNELPGLSAKAVVKPGTEVGTTDVVLRTTDRPVTGSLSVDNHGRESIGETRVSGSVNFNNPTGIDDQIQLLGLVSSSSLLTYGFAGYNFPIGFGGARAFLSYGFADFEVDDVAGLTGDSRNARLGLYYPVILTTREALRISATISDTRTSTDLQGGAPTPGTSITVLEVGAAYNLFHSNAAITQLTTTLSTNFEEQERADLAPPVGQDVDGKQMARLEVDMLHIQPIGAGFAVSGRVNTVWSPDPLSDPQAYSIGGPQSVRGFPASEVRGDRGHFAQLTLQHRSAIGALRLTPRVYVDSGQVSLVDPPPAVDKDDHLTSVGVGTDLEWRRFVLKLDVSEPGGSRIDPADGKEFSTRFFGSLLINF
jgi:hemolysin activation/secretion protein